MRNEHEAWVEAIRNLLTSEPLTVSEAELEETMNEELEKEPEDMDTDLVDFCVDTLTQIRSGMLQPITKQAETKTEKASPVTEVAKKPEQTGARKNRRRRNIRRTLLVAAIITILSTMTITVLADENRFHFSDSVVSFFEDVARVDFKKSKNENNTEPSNPADSGLVAELAEHGITSVHLPQALLNGDWEQDGEITYKNDSTTKYAFIAFKNGNNQASVNVVQGSDISQENNIPRPQSGEMIVVNGRDVFIFQQEKYSHITYFDGNTKYAIYVECEVKQAVEIAETIE